MAGGLFARVRTWIKGDTVHYDDLNNEFNNIIQNLQPQYLDNYSHTISQMQSTLSPGDVGSEVQAASLAQEIQELRYQVQALSGAVQWYSPPITTISQLNTTINGVFPTAPNRIVSGARTTFDQPYFLIPGISAPSITVKGSITPLLVYINSAATTINSDITQGTLTLAPATGNTCVVNDPTLAGTQATKTQGEDTTVLQISSPGANISLLNNQYCGFKIGSEYFIGEVNLTNTQLACTFVSTTNPTTNYISATAHGLNLNDQVTFTGGGLPANVTAGVVYYAIPNSQNRFNISATVNGTAITFAAAGNGTGTVSKSNCIQKCFRGYFFDNAGAPIARAAVSNGATITLMKLTWVFVSNSSGTFGINITYNRPIVSYTTPLSPSIGDYWLDLSVNKWKQYTGSTFAIANAELLGVCIQDTANTVGARSFDFAQPYNALNSVKVAFLDTANLRSSNLSSKINVYGNGLSYDYSYLTWNTALNMDTGLTIAASTTYYCYVSDLGVPFISDQAPYNRSFDLFGFYHPSKPWRCVATFTTDGSSLIVSSSVAQPFIQSYLPAASVYNANLVPGAVTIDKRGALNYAISNSNTLAGGDVNLTCTITTHGNPVFMGIISDFSTPSTYGAIAVSAAGSTSGMQFKRNGTVIISMNQRGTTGNLPPGMYWFLDDNAGAGLPAGEYTFSASDGASTLGVSVRFVCFELG